ncbi:MAG TPA: hypothetical protein VFN26_11630 [Candidatus Acidoferrum sp.]|nr:hypothetical protein [Candidatus Acidoferrum sp.]
MRDDGKRPRATGDPSESLRLENDDHEHRILELLDAHPWARTLIEQRERISFLEGYRAAMVNHTDEFVERASLGAYARWIASQ